MRTPPQPPRGPTPPKAGPPPRPAAKSAAQRKPPRKLPAWLVRARNLILKPSQEWTSIAGEFATPGSIYQRYLVPIAAIGPLATTLGTLAFGVRATLAGVYKVSPLDALADGVLRYGFGLLGVYALAAIISAAATTFGGQKNPVQALKLAAYGSTPYWLGGVCSLIPKLGVVGLVVGLYSFRLFALGLPALMKSPRDKTGAYTLVVVIASVLVTLLARALPVLFV